MVRNIKVKMDNLFRENMREVERQLTKKKLASTIIVGTLEETVSQVTYSALVTQVAQI